MNTRRYKVIGNGNLIGFILICDDNPNYDNCKIGSIFKFHITGEWTDNNLEFIGNNLINDLFKTNISDEEIQKFLLSRAGISKDDYNNFDIIENR